MSGGTFTLTIRLDNAAFDDDECSEVARILAQLVGHLRSVPELDYAHSRRLMDINGNVVGEVRVERPRSEA
jgi:hypothetical protein